MSAQGFDRRMLPIRYPHDVVLSTAQNLEDVLLNRVFEGKREGAYLDIGAGDPNIDSVTRWFYSIGWRGCNVEPNPRFAEAYQQYRPDDINLFVGVGSAARPQTFYRVDRGELVEDAWGISTFDPAAAQSARDAGFLITELELPTLPLSEITSTHLAGRSIDFMKIDVEGYEGVVLQSADWRDFRPAVVLVEATEPSRITPSHGPWEPLLLAVGYVFALFDGLNAYYVPVELSEGLLPQFNAGVNLNDRFQRIDPSSP